MSTLCGIKFLAIDFREFSCILTNEGGNLDKSSQIYCFPCTHNIAENILSIKKLIMRVPCAINLFRREHYVIFGLVILKNQNSSKMLSSCIRAPLYI